MKERILRYSITTAACLVVAFIICALGGIFSMHEDFRIYGLLCDAFFIVGVFVAAVGLLIFASNQGVFEMLVYGVMRFFSLFKKKPKEVKYETFYDYHVARAERNKFPYTFLIIVGLGFIIVALIFLLIWSRCYPWDATIDLPSSSSN